MSEDEKPCPYCAETIKAAAVVCRFCGRELTDSSQGVSGRRGPNLTIAVILLVILGAICIQTFTFWIPNLLTWPGSLLSTPPIVAPVITLSEYNRLAEGMSYGDAVRVIGQKGAELSTSSISASPGFTEGVTVSMYSWENGDGSTATLIFQNDRLLSKAQINLPTR